MSQMGHQRRFERAPATSAVPPKADIPLRCNICRDGPTTDIGRCLWMHCAGGALV